MLSRCGKHHLARSLLTQNPSRCMCSGRRSGGKLSVSSTSKPFDTSPTKGTRDFFPPDLRLRNWLFDKWRSVALRFGFEEYDASVVESEALYTRKAGEDIAEQLFNFQDKSERRLSLRPEMTPSLARMILSKGTSLPMPIKWFSVPQCWRYEKMQRGRRREHYQWNMDIWGVSSVEAEAELLAAIVTFFRDVGLTSADIGIKINSRLILNGILSSLGVPQMQFGSVLLLIDKLDKLPMQQIVGGLEQCGISAAASEELLHLLKNGSMELTSAYLSKHSASQSMDEIKNLLDMCDMYGIKDWLVFDLGVVRGLSYYTGVVFEAFDRSGELRAICGGGRYDNLLEAYTGSASKAVPAVGFGFGDAVIMEVLMARQLLSSEISQYSVDVVVFALNDELKPHAISICNQLREKAFTVNYSLQSKSAKQGFQYAAKCNADIAVFLAPDEVNAGKVVVKNMKLKRQSSVDINDIIAHVQKERLQ